MGEGLVKDWTLFLLGEGCDIFVSLCPPLELEQGGFKEVRPEIVFIVS